MEMHDRVHIDYGSSKALQLETGFPDPVSIDRLSLLFLRPAHVPDSYPLYRLSGGCGSPATLLLRHQRPHDARHPVGQRHGVHVRPLAGNTRPIFAMPPGRVNLNNPYDTPASLLNFRQVV